MQQLSAIDSQFLAFELPECPMNMGLLITLEGPYSAHSIDHLMKALKTGSLRVERHHQRLWYSVFRHDFPYWLNDNSLQVGKHVRHHQLDKPGSNTQLHALVEKLLMRPMDRTQPLWEFHLISGLQDGKHALIFKLHHACADGLAALKMFARTVAEPDNLEVNWPPTEKDSSLRKNWFAFTRLLKNPLRPLYNNMASMVLKIYLFKLSFGKSGKPTPQHTRFIGPISNQRSYATLDFSLHDFRRINRKFGSSENELLMTLYSGALRRYLLDRQELPERSLHAGMPISMMFSSERKHASNEAGLIRVTLGTRIADPVQRLQTMKSRCARALEKKPSKLWRRLEVLWLNASPRLIALAAQVYRKLLQLGRLPLTASAITTYMPGPTREVAIGDFRIEAIYPLSVIYHGCGLSISAMRYAKKIHCGIYADKAMLPDPEKLTEYMQQELEQIYRAASPSEH